MERFSDAVWEIRPVCLVTLQRIRPSATVSVSGLLADHVLAGLRGHDRGNHVPMIGRGHAHHVDVLAADQLAEVALRIAALVIPAERSAVIRIDLRLRGRQSHLVHVADGDDLGVGVAIDLLEVPIHAVRPAPDIAVNDPIAGSRGAAAAENGRRQHQGAAAAPAARAAACRREGTPPRGVYDST